MKRDLFISLCRAHYEHCEHVRTYLAQIGAHLDNTQFRTALDHAQQAAYFARDLKETAEFDYPRSCTARTAAHFQPTEAK